LMVATSGAVVVMEISPPKDHPKRDGNDHEKRRDDRQRCKTARGPARVAPIVKPAERANLIAARAAKTAPIGAPLATLDRTLARVELDFPEIFNAHHAALPFFLRRRPRMSSCTFCDVRRLRRASCFCRTRYSAQARKQGGAVHTVPLVPETQPHSSPLA